MVTMGWYIKRMFIPVSASFWAENFYACKQKTSSFGSMNIILYRIGMLSLTGCR